MEYSSEYVPPKVETTGTEAEVNAVSRALYDTMFSPNEVVSDETWQQVWESSRFSGTRFRLETQARAMITALDKVRANGTV